MKKYISIMIVILLLAGIGSAQNYMPEFSMEPGAGITFDGGYILNEYGMIGPDAIVYSDGINIIARWKNGTLLASGTHGTNDSEVINTAYQAVNTALGGGHSYGVVEVYGTITTESTIYLNQSMTFIHRGVLIPGCSPAVKIGKENGDGNVERGHVDIGYINDSTFTYTAVELSNICQSYIHINGIKANGGIHVNNSSMCNDNIIDCPGIMAHDFGIKMFIDTHANAVEGNQIRIPYIDCNDTVGSNGIWIYGGGVAAYNQFFTGIDNCDMAINETDGGNPTYNYRQNMYYTGILYNASKIDVALTSMIYGDRVYPTEAGRYFAVQQYTAATPVSGSLFHRGGRGYIWNSTTASDLTFGTAYGTPKTKLYSTTNGVFALYVYNGGRQIFYAQADGDGTVPRLYMSGALNLKSSAASTPTDGDFWYDNTNHKLYLRSGGSTYTFSPDA